MNPRYLETFRRHRILFVLPVVLAVVVAGWAALGEPTLYRSSLSLWSDTTSESNEAFGAPPPAAEEQTMLNELLTTQSFRTNVARNGPLADYLERNPSDGSGPTALLKRMRSTPTLDDRISAALGPKRVTSTIEGPHVLKINFDATSPTLALETLRVLVQEFTKQREVLRRDAVSAAERQVATASRALGRARGRLTNYVQDHSSATRADPRLRALSETERRALIELATATESLNRETTAVLNGSSGRATLRIVDAPQLPIGPSAGRKKLAMTILAGLFVGTLLSILGIVALTKVTRPRVPGEAVLPLEAAPPDGANGIRKTGHSIAGDLAGHRSRFEQTRLERSG